MNYCLNQAITVFGDSISKGFFYDDIEIKKLENPVVDMLNSQCYLCINNKSIFGQSLKRAYEKSIFEKYLSEINKSENNIAIIALGGNDSDYDWRQVENNPSISHSSKTDESEFECLLYNIIERFQRNNIKVVLCSLCPIISKRYFENVLSKKFDREKILSFLKGDIENLYRHQEIFNNIIIRVAIKTNCLFFDYRSEFLKRNDFQSLMSKDGIHPNQLGHNLLFELATKFIEKSQKSLILNLINEATNIKAQQKMLK